MKTKLLLLASIFFFNFSTNVNDIENIFSQAKKIEIYAFYNFTKWDKNEISNYFKEGKIVIPVKYLRNRIVLDKNQVAKLKASLTEIRYKQANVAPCYDQRHSIVFYDKRDKAIGYVNICFENFNSIPSKKLETSERLVYSLFFQKELFKEFGITYFNDTPEDIEYSKKEEKNGTEKKEVKKKRVR